MSVHDHAKLITSHVLVKSLQAYRVNPSTGSEQYDQSHMDREITKFRDIGFNLATRLASNCDSFERDRRDRSRQAADVRDDCESQTDKGGDKTIDRHKDESFRVDVGPPSVGEVCKKGDGVITEYQSANKISPQTKVKSSENASISHYKGIYDIVMSDLNNKMPQMEEAQGHNRDSRPSYENEDKTSKVKVNVHSGEGGDSAMQQSVNYSFDNVIKDLSTDGIPSSSRRACARAGQIDIFEARVAHARMRDASCDMAIPSARPFLRQNSDLYLGQKNSPAFESGKCQHFKSLVHPRKKLLRLQSSPKLHPKVDCEEPLEVKGAKVVEAGAKSGSGHMTSSRWLALDEELFGSGRSKPPRDSGEGVDLSVRDAEEYDSYVVNKCKSMHSYQNYIEEEYEDGQPSNTESRNLCKIGDPSHRADKCAAEERDPSNNEIKHNTEKRNSSDSEIKYDTENSNPSNKDDGPGFEISDLTQASRPRKLGRRYLSKADYPTYRENILQFEARHIQFEQGGVPRIRAKTATTCNFHQQNPFARSPSFPQWGEEQGTQGNTQKEVLRALQIWGVQTKISAQYSSQKAMPTGQLLKRNRNKSEGSLNFQEKRSSFYTSLDESVLRIWGIDKAIKCWKKKTKGQIACPGDVGDSFHNNMLALVQKWKRISKGSRSQTPDSSAKKNDLEMYSGLDCGQTKKSEVGAERTRGLRAIRTLILGVYLRKVQEQLKDVNSLSKVSQKRGTAQGIPKPFLNQKSSSCQESLPDPTAAPCNLTSSPSNPNLVKSSLSDSQILSKLPPNRVHASTSDGDILDMQLQFKVIHTTQSEYLPTDSKVIKSRLNVVKRAEVCDNKRSDEVMKYELISEAERAEIKPVEFLDYPTSPTKRRLSRYLLGVSPTSDDVFFASKSMMDLHSLPMNRYSICSIQDPGDEYMLQKSIPETDVNHEFTQNQNDRGRKSSEEGSLLDGLTPYLRSHQISSGNLFCNTDKKSGREARFTNSDSLVVSPPLEHVDTAFVSKGTKGNSKTGSQQMKRGGSFARDDPRHMLSYVQRASPEGQSCDSAESLVSDISTPDIPHIRGEIPACSSSGSETISPPAPETSSSSAPKTTSPYAPKIISLSSPKTISLSNPKTISISTPKVISLSTPKAISLSTPNNISLSTPKTISLSSPKTISLSTLKCISSTATDSITSAVPTAVSDTDIMIQHFKYSEFSSDEEVRVQDKRQPGQPRQSKDHPHTQRSRLSSERASPYSRPKWASLSRLKVRLASLHKAPSSTTHRYFSRDGPAPFQEVSEVGKQRQRHKYSSRLGFVSQGVGKLLSLYPKKQLESSLASLWVPGILSIAQVVLGSNSNIFSQALSAASENVKPKECGTGKGFSESKTLEWGSQEDSSPELPRSRPLHPRIHELKSGIEGSYSLPVLLSLSDFHRPVRANQRSAPKSPRLSRADRRLQGQTTQVRPQQSRSLQSMSLAESQQSQPLQSLPVVNDGQNQPLQSLPVVNYGQNQPLQSLPLVKDRQNQPLKSEPRQFQLLQSVSSAEPQQSELSTSASPTGSQQTQPLHPMTSEDLPRSQPSQVVLSKRNLQNQPFSPESHSEFSHGQSEQNVSDEISSQIQLLQPVLHAGSMQGQPLQNVPEVESPQTRSLQASRSSKESKILSPRYSSHKETLTSQIPLIRSKPEVIRESKPKVLQRQQAHADQEPETKSATGLQLPTTIPQEQSPAQMSKQQPSLQMPCPQSELQRLKLDSYQLKAHTKQDQLSPKCKHQQLEIIPQRPQAQASEIKHELSDQRSRLPELLQPKTELGLPKLKSSLQFVDPWLASQSPDLSHPSPVLPPKLMIAPQVPNLRMAAPLRVVQTPCMERRGSRTARSSVVSSISMTCCLSCLMCGRNRDTSEV